MLKRLIRLGCQQIVRSQSQPRRRKTFGFAIAISAPSILPRSDWQSVVSEAGNCCHSGIVEDHSCQPAFRPRRLPPVTGRNPSAGNLWVQPECLPSRHTARLSNGGAKAPVNAVSLVEQTVEGTEGDILRVSRAHSAKSERSMLCAD